MLLVSVPSYEEQLDSSGNQVTYYVVNVEDVSIKLHYYLMKRYSSFLTLKSLLIDQYPALESFKFPNKSLFHTHSQFTKERRREGFDQFMKMLSTYDTVPPEFEEFLELHDHIKNYQKVIIPNGNDLNNNNSNSNTKTNDEQNKTIENNAVSLTNREPHLITRLQRSFSTINSEDFKTKSLKNENSENEAENDDATILNEKIKTQFPKIIKYSFIINLFYWNLL